ncbi:hypothetical protein [Yersinia kristensenii]|uniref:hypothetical protein n=1 Tax=Yersinia kristensenii TaxID=28152 RepID=UPI0005E33A80|nr:hypothetical protein [Yersinia kristensenii]CFR23271.1 acetyltransferase domain-containing protein [Yersinia kristensenii]
MNINNQVSKVFYSLIFISFSAISNHFNDDNVCFYSGDNYTEKGDSKKFCVPSYTEDEWLFSQWNNNISSIKIPLNFQVDVFSDFSFSGKSVSIYKNTNAAELEKYGLISDISSYRVSPKSLYPSNKRVIFNYHSNLFQEKYIGYNYYLSRGHSILLSRKDKPSDIDSQSSSVFYSYTGQIMTAFSGQGFDRNLYCLLPTDLRAGKLTADVAFSYCDFGTPGQRWFPQKIAEKIVLVNQGTGTALSLDEEGFYVSLKIRPNIKNQFPGREKQDYQPEVEVNSNTVEFNDKYIEEMKTSAVRPFLQYKETFAALNEFGHRDFVVNHLDKTDDTNIYLGGDKIGEHVYYNSETKSLIAYNKSNNERMLTETSCLSLVNNATGAYLPVNFTYNRSSYSDNSIEYRCDNGIAYNPYAQQWNFIMDHQSLYLVNGYENKVLHFHNNENPQKMDYRGVLFGPELGARIGHAVNFNERKPEGAIFISSLPLGYILDMEQGVCELRFMRDKSGVQCGGGDTTWSSTDYHVQNISLSRDYIPWLLPRILNRLHRNEWTDELAAFLQEVETLETLFEKNSNQPANKAALEKTKALLVTFLHTYNSTEYTKIWHQAAHVLNRVDVLIEWGNNSAS